MQNLLFNSAWILRYSGLQNPRHFRNFPLVRPCLYKQLLLVVLVTMRVLFRFRHLAGMWSESVSDNSTSYYVMYIVINNSISFAPTHHGLSLYSRRAKTAYFDNVPTRDESGSLWKRQDWEHLRKVLLRLVVINEVWLPFPTPHSLRSTYGIYQKQLFI